MTGSEFMLLTIDVGNTNTVLGVFRGEELIAHWRLTTARLQTVDEYGVLTRNLFTLKELDPKQVRGVIISSVVPPMNWTLSELSKLYFEQRAMFVEAGVKTGMAVLVDNPLEVGADRVVNGVAAFHKYGGPCIVVDFGTAITFDAISANAEYLGGIISAGIGISIDALFARTARLPRVDFREPDKLIGTEDRMALVATHVRPGADPAQALALVQKLGPETKVIATGGQANLIAAQSRYLKVIDENLTLDGLEIIWNRIARP